MGCFVCCVLFRINFQVLWNTAVVIDHTGRIMGKTRKNHIPRWFSFYFFDKTIVKAQNYAFQLQKITVPFVTLTLK